MSFNRFFAEFYKRCMGVYHEDCREVKRKHFESMKSHVSADPELKKKGVIRILEIGAASGYNFEFYPAGSELTVVEVNPFFEKQFFEKQKEHPHIVMKRFVVGFAEDMKEVEDNSIDIVVSTMVLCSVRSIQKTLNEVQRVLAPVSSILTDSNSNLLNIIQLQRAENIITGNTSATKRSGGSAGFNILLRSPSTTWSSAVT